MIITEVDCDGYLAQLAEEIIDSYDTAGKAVTDIVTDLLAFQRRATKITKGTIAPTDTRALKVDGKTILAALLQLKESVGGYIDVGDDRVLQWAVDIGEDKGQQIRYYKNLRGITRETNYNDLCTKLHLLGGAGIKLSDIDVVKEAAAKDSEDPYGYLALTAQYACYKDWVGLGEALPTHITVYKGLPASISLTPVSHNDPENGWNHEEDAYDGNIATQADSNNVVAGDWTKYLYFELTKQLMTGARFYAFQLSTVPAKFGRIEVQATEDFVSWSTVFNEQIPADEEWSNQWIEFAFSTRMVWGFRIRFYRMPGATTSWCDLFEFEGRTDYQNDTALWHQGANEKTLRCAIGNYDAANDYFISYTHAGYLVAWDKIVTDDDFISKTITNKYEAYVASLLEAGRLILDEVKEVPVSYSIKTVDLSESEEFDFDFEALQLGSIVTILDEELGISVVARVVKIIHPDLLHPQDMEIEITNQLRDIADVIANMYKELG